MLVSYFSLVSGRSCSHFMASAVDIKGGIRQGSCIGAVLHGPLRGCLEIQATHNWVMTLLCQS